MIWRYNEVNTSVTQITLEGTVDSRYLDFAYLKKLLISKWKSGPYFNM